MRSLVWLAFLPVALSGCASSGPIGKEVLTGSLSPQKSRLVIYRVSPMGFAVQPSYEVNGKSVSPSQPNGFVACDLKPGPYKVSVANVPININLFGGTDKATVVLKPGQTTYIKAVPQMGVTIGIITITEVTAGQGRNDTAQLHRIEGKCPTV